MHFGEFSSVEALQTPPKVSSRLPPSFLSNSNSVCEIHREEDERNKNLGKRVFSRCTQLSSALQTEGTFSQSQVHIFSSVGPQGDTKRPDMIYRERGCCKKAVFSSFEAQGFRYCFLTLQRSGFALVFYSFFFTQAMHDHVLIFHCDAVSCVLTRVYLLVSALNFKSEK